MTLLRHINRTLSLRGKQKRVFSDYWSTNSEGEKHLSQPAATIVLIHQCNDSENALGICGWSGRERSIFFPLRRTAAGDPCRWSWMTASIFTWTQLLIRSSGWACRLMEAALSQLSRNFSLFMCAPQNMCTTPVSHLVILMARLRGQKAARRLAASTEAVLGQRGAVHPGQRVSLA